MAGRRWAYLVAVVSVAGVAVAAAGGEATAPTELPVRVQKGVTYSTAGGEDLQLDVAAPATGGPYPAVLVLHGGAWRLGSRGYLSQSAARTERQADPSVHREASPPAGTSSPRPATDSPRSTSSRPRSRTRRRR